MITYGCDPEVFYSLDGMVIPAGMVFPDRISYPEGDLYVDGAALEFQPNPSPDPAQVVANLLGLLEKSKLLTDLEVSIVPEMPIDLEWCRKIPELAVFGCDPDDSVWGEECIPGTIDAETHPWRYAGFHIHLGLPSSPRFFLDSINRRNAIRALDRTVGLTSLALAKGTGDKRRSIYGRPGIYRIQPWGIEYRTPSNVLMLSPERVESVFRLAGETLELVLKGKYKKMVDLIPDNLVVQALRFGSWRDAAKLAGLVLTAFGLEEVK